MKEFIMKYWLEIVFGTALSGLSGLYIRLKAKLKRQKIIEAAILALLHDRLYQACNFYLERGYCSVDDKKNIEYMYKPYRELGGNGTAEHMYKQCQDLPIKSPPKGGVGNGKD